MRSATLLSDEIECVKFITMSEATKEKKGLIFKIAYTCN